MGLTFNVRLTIVRKKVGRIKEGVDNKFVRHAVELTIDKAVIPLGSRYFTKKPASHRSCPPVCLSAVLLYTLSRLFSYSSPLSGALIARVPLITALSLVGVKGTDDAAFKRKRAQVAFLRDSL